MNLTTILYMFILLKIHDEPEPRLVIHKHVVDVKKSNIKLVCSIINNGHKHLFYNSNTDNDFCIRINRVIMKDLTDGSVLIYKPCKYITDARRIILDSSNSVSLSANESYKFNLTLNTHNFTITPKIKHKYKIMFSISTTYICGGDTCSAFTGFMQSKKAELIYK